MLQVAKDNIQCKSLRNNSLQLELRKFDECDGTRLMSEKVGQGVTEGKGISSYKFLETFAIGDSRILVDPRTCIAWNTSRNRTIFRLLRPAKS